MSQIYVATEALPDSTARPPCTASCAASQTPPAATAPQSPAHRAAGSGTPKKIGYMSFFPSRRTHLDDGIERIAFHLRLHDALNRSSIRLRHVKLNDELSRGNLVVCRGRGPRALLLRTQYQRFFFGFAGGGKEHTKEPKNLMPIPEREPQAYVLCAMIPHNVL